MYRAAWHAGLKTTYYLRTPSASHIEEATLNLHKELRGVVAQTASGTAASGSPNGSAAAQVEEATEGERLACRLEAMLNGGTCEACQ
jgi:ribonucleoside-diphosphate reductase alpha chain